MDRGGRGQAAAYVATAAVAAAVFGVLALVSLLVVKPLGTVAAFVVGAFVVAERHELGESVHVQPWWLAALGVFVAVAVPALLIVD